MLTYQVSDTMEGIPMTERACLQRRIERTFLIDADDTLWQNNIFYLRCNTAFGEYMSTLGIDPEETMAAFSECEQEAVQISGYGPQGYVKAMEKACARLLTSAGCQPEPAHVEEARAIGVQVLCPPMILLPEVEATLRGLWPNSQLVMVTKGDQATQRGKLERSGLTDYFDHVYVVPEKNADVYRAIAAELGLTPGHTWMVGNSPKSDINPAIAAGLGAILVPHCHTWIAELEELERPEQVVTLRCFADLLPLFGIESTI
jgi:putative hydrolase of the HAD superfamily